MLDMLIGFVVQCLLGRPTGWLIDARKITDMMGRVLAAAVRRQLSVLMLGVVPAVGNAAAIAFAPSMAQLLFLPLVVLALALLVLGLLSFQNRPACFVVQPQIPAFGTPVPAWRAGLGVCLLLPVSAEVGALIRSIRQDNLWAPELILDISWLLLVALLLAEAWRGRGGCSCALTAYSRAGFSARSLCHGRRYPWPRRPCLPNRPQRCGWPTLNPGWYDSAAFPGGATHCAQTTSIPGFSPPRSITTSATPITGPPSAATRSTNASWPSCPPGPAADDGPHDLLHR